LLNSRSPAVSEILGSDRIVVTSLTFRGYVTLLHGHMTWIRHRPFIWWSFGTKPNGFRDSVFNGECDTMVDVTLIRPLNEVKVHWPSSSAFGTDETAGRS